MTQTEAAAKMGIKQPGYRRFEDSNHPVWKTDSLWAIARAYGVRVNISFETFGTLPDEKLRLSKESLRRPKFEDDPAFKEPAPELESEEASERPTGVTWECTNQTGISKSSASILQQNIVGTILELEQQKSEDRPLIRKQAQRAEVSHLVPVQPLVGHLITEGINARRY
jgi:hypothetical protein